jgi:hypothetical protein
MFWLIVFLMLGSFILGIVFKEKLMKLYKKFTDWVDSLKFIFTNKGE